MGRGLKILASLALAVLFLWLFLRHTDWTKLAESLRHADPVWIAWGVVLITVSLFTRVQRWARIVRSVRPISFRHLFSATQIGMLANLCLPLRAGEIVRATCLTRLSGAPLAQSLALSALDRGMDILGMLAVLVVATFALHSTGDIVLPADVFGTDSPLQASAGGVRAAAIGLGAALAAAIAAMALAYFNLARAMRWMRRLLSWAPPRFAEWVCGILKQFGESMHVFRSGRDMGMALWHCLVTWILFLASLQALILAFHISAPWHTVFVMLAFTAISLSVPGAPGFVGQFHIPVVISLAMLCPGLPIPQAKAFAIVAHLVSFGPEAVAGIYCLWREKIFFRELASAESKSQRASG